MTDSVEQRQKRSSALEDLVHRRVPLPQAIQALAAFGWDSDHDLVTLTPDDVLSALEDFKEGRLSDSDLVMWAEAIEGREDVGFAPHAESVLKRFIFEIANPDLTEPISPELVRNWKQRLWEIMAS